MSAAATVAPAATAGGPSGPSGFSIDPDSWEEPFYTFPGIVRVSCYRWAREEYQEKFIQRLITQNKVSREHIEASLAKLNPNGEAQIPQWQLDVERLDAKFLLPDGSHAPATQYGGYDLVKWSNRDNGFVAINLNFGKEAYISGTWKKIAGTIQPPEVLEGKMFTFNFYPSKRFGGPQPAKRILVPESPLPPTYTFDGEMQLIQVRDQGQVSGSDGSSASASESAGGAPVQVSLSEEEILDRLVSEVLVSGTATTEAVKLVTAVPADLRVSFVMNGLADGSILRRLQSEGKIALDSAGVVVG